jgi:hypothetical protein
VKKENKVSANSGLLSGTMQVPVTRLRSCSTLHLGKKQIDGEQLKDAIEQLEELKGEQEKVLKKIKFLLVSQP